jgi:L-ascorbate metabolism protein UlaG (beta-lactamase superfamily)
MKLTHFGHSCVLVDTGDTRLLIDPGAFSDGFADIEQIDGLLITHKDFDHFAPDTVVALMDAHPDATLVVEAATADLVPESIPSSRTKVVASGERFHVAGVEITAVGGIHGTIHALVERIPNIGFFFDDLRLLHPGDEFVVPDAGVEVLALPISGPWLSLADAVDYLRAVDPQLAFPIHEKLHAYPDVYYRYVNMLKPERTTFQVLEAGIPLEV